MKIYGSHEDTYIVYAGPRTGKALALDTLVPTPTGWVAMGDLNDGDVVYGSSGKPTRVLHAWPTRFNRPCYDLTFSDGTVITADAEHLWRVDSLAARRSAGAQKYYMHNTPGRSQQHKRQFTQVLTTAEMAKNVRAGSDDRANYSIEVAAALKAPEADLLIPPYTLGAWLGDGTTWRGEITTLDPEIITEIEAEGERCKLDVSPSGQRRCPGYRIEGLKTRLRSLGVLGNKHIPTSYLRASESQRRALLAGLMDTDGYCGRTVIEFAVTNERLARDVRHLVSTLGYKSTLRSKPASLYGKPCGTAWTVCIATGVDRPLFRLARKTARQLILGMGRQTERVSRRYITDIKPVPSAPVRCITVDSPDSLYLVGETCIPTHNTGFLSDVLHNAPGFGLSTSTRPDVWGHTSIPRARRGPILTLDPDPFSGIGSSLAWDMLDGCVLPQIAIERAGYLMNAAPKNDGGKDAWWDHQSAELLRLLLHAGELAGANLMDVRAWAGDPSTKEPVEELYKSPFAAQGWAEELDELASSTDGDYLQGVARGVTTALGWLADPAMSAIACPAPGKSMDAWQLMAEGGTVYLIGANKPHGSIAAFCASLTSHFWETGKRMAALSPGFRLDPPALFVIDEPAITCPVPLDRWFAEAGGWGMPVATGVQSPAQLIRQWGEQGARIIRDCATIEIVFGGNTDDKELASIAAICGGQDSWDHVPGTRRRNKQTRETQLYPPERIRKLDDGHAIVLHRNARPVEVKVSRVWERPGYERAEAMPITPSYAGPVWPDGTPVITGNAEPALERGDGTLSITERNC